MFRKITVVLIILSLLTLTGCYDNRETDSLATVMAVGIDLLDNGDKNYTFAVADTGGFTKDSSGEGSSMICFTQSGKNIKLAADMLDAKISKKLSFSHLSLLVFSNFAAENGMYEETIFFEKKASVRPQTMIAVLDGKAEDYLNNLKPSLESNPEKYFQSIFQNSNSYVSTLRLCDLTNGYHTGSTLLSPLISAESESEELSEENAYVFGSAVISYGKMKTVFKDNWIAGLFLSNKQVAYDAITLQSVGTPKIDVNVNSEIPKITAKLFIKSSGKINKDKIEKEIENTLKAYAKASYDIINVSTQSKRSFLLERNYDAYNIREKIPKAEFNVNIELIAEEMIDDV